jgi:hypothetical protein
MKHCRPIADDLIGCLGCSGLIVMVLFGVPLLLFGLASWVTP